MMTRAIRAEIRKFFTTRMWWGMAIGVAVVSGGFAALAAGFLQTPTDSEPVDPEMGIFPPAQLAISAYTAGSQFGYTLLMVIGILLIGTEYRNRTLTSSLLAVPRRSTLILAKCGSLLVIGVAYGVLFVACSVGAGAAILTARGLEPMLGNSEVLRSVLLLLLVLALWALIGLGLGVLIPNQIAAILTGVSLAIIVEPVITLIIGAQDWGEDVAKFMPSRATSAILGGWSGEDNELLSWGAASAVLLVYAAIATGIGILLTNRRDVS